MDLLAITWDISPEIFSIGVVTVRWYGLLFALGFVTGQYIITKIFKHENKPEVDLDTLLLVMVISTVLGARLGHCLFYQPDYYLANPLEILKLWEGGLASHGAITGILIGLWLYVNFKMPLSWKFPFLRFIRHKREGQSFLWVTDRIVIVGALGASFIRLGNFFNSEIVGIPTNVSWGVIFAQNGETFARHPAQLYESISCFLLFLITYFLYQRTKEKTPEGRIFGLFVFVLFTLRFFYEFLKENQVDFENNIVLNMGQILSIPLVIFGLVVFIRSFRKKTVNPAE